MAGDRGSPGLSGLAVVPVIGREILVMDHYVVLEPTDHRLVDFRRQFVLGVFAGFFNFFFQFANFIREGGVVFFVGFGFGIVDGGLEALLIYEVLEHIIAQEGDGLIDAADLAPVQKDFGLAEQFFVLLVNLGYAGFKLVCPLHLVIPRATAGP